VGLAAEDGRSIRLVTGPATTYELALEAAQAGQDLKSRIEALGLAEEVDYQAVIDQGRLLLPLDHPDPAHFLITGTGLTHLGSAQSRDAMHRKLDQAEELLTDSMRIFKAGLAGGKPAPGQIGFQPEWFYKGDGDFLVLPGAPLPQPAFAQDGGEEAEIVGLYVIDPQGRPLRLGFALGNEFSDHVMEQPNYLNLAHSKLRASSFGPELLLGDLPARVEGRIRILRDGEELWADEFLSGEDNMSHAIANLEHHHFKYDLFRRPGDAHCHFIGASNLSFSHQVRAEPGDVFEISCPLFGRPLINPLAVQEDQGLVRVKSL
jgi:hypothetical protein